MMRKLFAGRLQGAYCPINEVATSSVDCALVQVPGVMQTWLLCAQRAGSWFFTTSCVRELLAALAVCLLDSPTLAYYSGVRCWDPYLWWVYYSSSCVYIRSPGRSPFLYKTWFSRPIIGDVRPYLTYSTCYGKVAV